MAAKKSSKSKPKGRVVMTGVPKPKKDHIQYVKNGEVREVKRQIGAKKGHRSCR